MSYTWDEDKHQATIAARGLDFADAEKIFQRGAFTWEDDRFAYGEQRFITLGLLGADVVVLSTPKTRKRSA